MKKHLLIAGFLACCSTLFLLTACSDSSEKDRKDAKENVQDAKEDMKDASQDMGNALKAERDELSAKMEQAGRDIDAEITAIDQKMDKATAKEKVRWQERRKKLAAERDELNADMNRVGEDMKDGWSDFKTSVAKKLDNISEDLKSDDR